MSEPRANPVSVEIESGIEGIVQIFATSATAGAAGAGGAARIAGIGAIHAALGAQQAMNIFVASLRVNNGNRREKVITYAIV